jgi:hypothetical protein
VSQKFPVKAFWEIVRLSLSRRLKNKQLPSFSQLEVGKALIGNDKVTSKEATNEAYPR